MFRAVLAGLLLLGLTVLLVEAVVGRAEARRWHSAARPPVRKLLELANDPSLVEARQVIVYAAPYGRPRAKRAPAIPENLAASEHLSDAATKVDAEADRLGPILTAIGEFLPVFDTTISLGVAARRAAKAATAYRQAVRAVEAVQEYRSLAREAATRGDCVGLDEWWKTHAAEARRSWQGYQAPSTTSCGPSARLRWSGGTRSDSSNSTARRYGTAGRLPQESRNGGRSVCSTQTSPMRS